MTALLLLLACTDDVSCMEGYAPDAEGNCQAVADTATDTGLTEPTEALPEAPWSPSELEGVLETLVSQGLPDQVALKDLYLEMLEDGRDRTCPNDDNTTIFAMLDDSCLADTGYLFYGIAGFLEAEKQPDDPEPDAADYVFNMAPASYEIHDAEGVVHYAGGAYYYEARYRDDGVEWLGETNGSYGYPRAEGLIGSGYAGSLDAEGFYGPDRTAVTAHGSLNLNGVAAFIDELVWDTEVCDGVVVGEYRVRTDDGYWYEATVGSDCELCGPVTYAGEDFGELCFDWAPALQRHSQAMETL